MSIESSDEMWTRMFELLYCRYDPNEDLIPQFLVNLHDLKTLVLTPPVEYRAPFAKQPPRIEKEATDAED